MASEQGPLIPSADFLADDWHGERIVITGVQAGDELISVWAIDKPDREHADMVTVHISPEDALRVGRDLMAKALFLGAKETE